MYLMYLGYETRLVMGRLRVRQPSSGSGLRVSQLGRGSASAQAKYALSRG